MDNASNCNKLAEILPEFLPEFGGMNARLRCLAHIVNLVAKVSLTHFIFFMLNIIVKDLHIFLF